MCSKVDTLIILGDFIATTGTGEKIRNCCDCRDDESNRRVHENIEVMLTLVSISMWGDCVCWWSSSMDGDHEDGDDVTASIENAIRTV